MPISKEQLSFRTDNEDVILTEEEVRKAASLMYSTDKKSNHYQIIIDYWSDHPHQAPQYGIAIFYALEKGLITLDEKGNFPEISI